jgi:uncharacterized protein (DUF58 family)
VTRPAAPTGLTRHRSGRLELYAVLCSVSLVAAVAAAQPGLVAFAAPFAVALVVGLAGGRQSPPPLSVEIRLPTPEVNEGDVVEIEVTLSCAERIGRCEFAVALPAHFELTEGEASQAPALRGGTPHTVSFSCRTRRWGRFQIGPVAVRVRDPGGIFTWEGRLGTPVPVRVLPGREPVRHLVRPTQVGSAAGEQRSRARGDGVELADIRQYVPGDRARSINWRVTGRLGKLHVNDRQPERNTDVVLFLDTFSDAGLGETVRVAWTLADTYLAHRDRVGLIGFGGVMSWIEPAGGGRQRQKLSEALEDTETFRSFAWKSVESIPTRALPARCLVIVVSPLVDERIQLAVATMRARGLDVGVVEIPARRDEGLTRTWSGRAAARLYAMEREMLRDRFMARGIAVVPFDRETGTEVCLAQMDAYRRQLRVGTRQ